MVKLLAGAAIIEGTLLFVLSVLGGILELGMRIPVLSIIFRDNDDNLSVMPFILFNFSLFFLAFFLLLSRKYLREMRKEEKTIQKNINAGI